jgi:hypothetical protein
MGAYNLLNDPMWQLFVQDISLSCVANSLFKIKNSTRGDDSSSECMW